MQCLIQIPGDIGDVFKTYRETDQVRPETRREVFLV